MVALAYLLRQPKYRGRKNHNLPIKFDREENSLRGVFFIDTLTMFLYTWDNRKEDMSNKFYQGWLGLWFFYDDDISIHWNRKNEFDVYQKHEKKNSFTVNETMTAKQAEEQADEWLADVLQEEKLRHADIN